MLSIEHTLHRSRFLQTNWHGLHAMTFSQHPSFFSIDKSGLIVEEIIRLVPKKRMVVYGTWQKRAVVAKIFFHKKQAKAHFEKEYFGINILKNHSIPTAYLYGDWISADQHIYVLLFERLIQVTSLSNMLTHTKNIIQTCLPVIAELATQHVLGVIQHDLHLNNFLINEQTVYTIDGSTIEQQSTILSKKTSMTHLAQLLSQLKINIAGYELTLFKRYAELRGWIMNDQQTRFFKQSLQKIRQKRWTKFKKKLFRKASSTQFLRIHHGNCVGKIDKAYWSESFSSIFRDPHDLFKRNDSVILKNGRSTTVLKFEMDGRSFVVKRYNKNSKGLLSTRLATCLKQTRAAHAWYTAHQLKFFGIPTATPIAYIEKRGGPFHLFSETSYFIMEYIPGMALDHYLILNEHNTKAVDQTIEQLSERCACLKQVHLTQHDWKANNLIVHSESKELVLIDIDGIRQCRTSWGLKQRTQRNIQRLFKDFIEYPIIYHKLKAGIL